MAAYSDSVIPQAVPPRPVFPNVWPQAAKSTSSNELHAANSGTQAAVGCGCRAPGDRTDRDRIHDR